MPYINTIASVGINGRKQQIIKERMGKAIELIPGKSEDWLMLSFRDNVRMFFKGEEDPCAMCQVKLYGSAQEKDYPALTAALTDIFVEELDIPMDRIYITYETIDTWGWNGGNL